MTGRPGRLELLLLAAVAAFTVAVAAASLWWPWAWDAGIFAWVGDVIRHGGLPYRDAWDAKGPFTYYVFAAIQQGAGLRSWPVRVVDLTLMATGAMGVAALVRRYGSGTMALWIALVLLLGYYASDFWNTTQPDAWIGAIAAIAMPLLLRDDIDQRPLWGIVAAFLLGLGLVQKPTFLALVPLPALAALLLPGRTAARRLLLATALTLVALMPAGLTAAYFAARGALPDLVEGYITLNMELSRQAGGLGRGMLYTLYFALFTTPLPLLLPTALAGFAVVLEDDRRAALVMLAWAAGMLLCVAVQRRFWPYHWHAVSWSLGPLAGIGLAATVQGATRARAGRSLAIVLVALTLYVLAFPLQRKVREWTRLMGGGYSSRTEYYHEFDREQSDLVGDDLDLAVWLTRHSDPGDRIFIWDSPLAYPLS